MSRAGSETASSTPLRSVIVPRGGTTCSLVTCWLLAALLEGAAANEPEVGGPARREHEQAEEESEDEADPLLEGRHLLSPPAPDSAPPEEVAAAPAPPAEDSELAGGLLEAPVPDGAARMRFGGEPLRARGSWRIPSALLLRRPSLRCSCRIRMRLRSTRRRRRRSGCSLLPRRTCDSPPPSEVECSAAAARAGSLRGWAFRKCSAAGRDERHAELFGARLDTAACRHFGVFDAERRVLALQRGLALERAPDGPVELQEPELERHDPDQRERDDPDPDAAGEQPVEQRLHARPGGDAERRGQRARGRGGACGTLARWARGPGDAARSHRGERARRSRHAVSRQRAGGGGRRHGEPSPSARSLRAARRRAEAARGFSATSSAEGTIERRDEQRRLGLAAAHAHGQLRRADAPPRALDEEALHPPVLERVEGDPRQHASLAQQVPGEGERPVELVELFVDGDAQRLEGALGGMPAAEARRRGDRSLDRLHELLCGVDRRLRAPRHDRPRDCAGVALLAELAQRAGEAALVPARDDLARGQLLRGVHAHVQRGVVGVGEAPLARVHLHRGHAEVEVHGVRPHALAREQLERLGVAGADESHRAGRLARERGESLLGDGVAVDRHERPGGAELLGDQPRVPAVAERAVDHRLSGLDPEELEQLAREHGRVRAAGGARGDAAGVGAGSAGPVAGSAAAAARELGLARAPIGLDAAQLAVKQRRRHAR